MNRRGSIEVLQIGDLAFGPIRKNIFEQFIVPELHLVRDHIYADMENRSPA